MVRSTRQHVGKAVKLGTVRLAFQLPDAYLALYHDQGLIPVKQLAFDRAVNTSTFIRTSPDHGTALILRAEALLMLPA